jgi:hypothetical protein
MRTLAFVAVGDNNASKPFVCRILFLCLFDKQIPFGNFVVRELILINVTALVGQAELNGQRIFLFTRKTCPACRSPKDEARTPGIQRGRTFEAKQKLKFINAVRGVSHSGHESIETVIVLTSLSRYK